MKNKYMTEYERYQLEVLLKKKTPVKEIAELLGKHRSTIYREIKRGTITLIEHYFDKDVYCADVGQRIHKENCANKGVSLKLNGDIDFIKYVEFMIKEKKYSPVALLADIKNKGLKFNTDICFKTLYNYIDKGLFNSITNKDLPVKKSRKKKNMSHVVSLKNLSGRSIVERPKEIEERKEYGHWELDTVIGKRSGRECLFVLTERMTRQEYIFKEYGKTVDSTVRVLDKLERLYGHEQFKKMFKTITIDNGVEFNNMERLEQSCLIDSKRTTVYYCHPYSAYERGSNENANKLIRRYIPKGDDISNYDESYIEYIQNWINDYPRKLLSFMSSNMLLQKLGIGAL